ncbi:hypothetical protein [Desulfogranum marinum]|uniref:hypothetical protein n=1 Tax=Desulfogranum marinum TaxID=453220 RepID=UPI0029C6C495|nr:hypothetical protein [Desulfogranum marinum]
MEAIGSGSEKIGALLEKTHLPEQISEVDFAGLFTNPWFLVPFIALVAYMIYKQSFRDLTIMGLLMGAWYASGTHYMQTLVVGDELQMNKVLPVLFGGAGVLGFIIYLLFGRSD